MKKASLLGLLIASLALFCFAAPVRADETPQTALIKNFYVQLVDTIKQGDQLGFSGRYKKLEPVVRKAFNLPLMARTSVGLAWSKAGQPEQQKLVDAFSAFSIANYASRFQRFDGEAFDVVGEKPAQGGVIVETKLTPKGGDPVGLNYLIRLDEAGNPRIVDVYLDAAISELATRRSEFTTLIKREGFPALVASLEAKAKKMGTP
jgi:phospholipid transport system substrate-binding protein